jgi:phenylalanyl-tRNA synthetase beta chain
MLINTKWLRDYLDPECTDREILDALPRAGLEIEQIHSLETDLQSVTVGFVREKRPIQGTHEMYAVDIEVSRGRVIPVVCATEHEVKIGWGVPIALAGTQLPTGRPPIKSDKFHGYRSEGMICLDGEMGMLATGSGLQVFHDEALLGLPLPSVIRISEHLLELNVLPNRPDFLGLIGIAREISALLGVRLRYPVYSPSEGDAGSSPVSVELRESGLCTRYACQLIKSVKVAASPHWLKSRLLAVGSRPINNVVDVTNFVLYEWGHPLHAFDYSKLKNQRVVVRRMRPGETLELLSGKTIDSTGEPLVIADADRPVALAGIMGGRETETNEKTVDVLLEAAHFDPVSIRETVNRTPLGLETRGTASSYRFERGTDPNTNLTHALGRASSLIVQLAGGQLAGTANDVYPVERKPKTFQLTPSTVNTCLGTSIDAKTIRESLERREMICSEDLAIQVPTWRVDVNDPVVLIEDVARQVGYDSIPTQASASMPTLGSRCVLDRLRDNVAKHLVASGYFECRNMSLAAPEADSMIATTGGDQIHIGNPSSRTLSTIRRSLIPTLLQCSRRNLLGGASSVRLFEIDRVFTMDKSREQPSEKWMVAAVVGGAVQEYDWRSNGATVDFYDAKGQVEHLLEAIGVESCRFHPFNIAPFASGAEISQGDVTLGHMGELAQGLIDTGTMTVQLFAFELELRTLETSFLKEVHARPIPNTPAITRDLDVVARREESFQAVRDEILNSAGLVLESLNLVDVYQGPQIPPDRKSLTFHLVFRDPERTLTAKEAADIMSRIQISLQNRFRIELRIS